MTTRSSVASVGSLLFQSFVNPRTSINAAPHFVPINMMILNKTLAKYLELVSVREFRNLLIRELELDIKKRIDAKNGLLYAGNTKVTNKNAGSYTPALVYENGELQGVLYRNFSGVQKNLTTSIMNKRLSIFLSSGRGLTRKQGFDTGHTVSSQDGSVLATVPVLEKANRLIDKLTSSSVGDSVMLADDPEMASKIVEEVLNAATQLKKEFKVHVTYGKVLKKSLTKDFRTAILSVSANIVLIQEREENQVDFSNVEKTFNSKLTQLLKTISFSNNLEEQVMAQIASNYTGKKPPKGKKTVEAPVANKPDGSNKTTSSLLPKIVSLKTNRNISLTSLQALLDKHLQDVISANMGDQGYAGGQRKILNYRTGRFAASAKVARLSQSRQGMITAFYTYMKNPYQTFEPGYRQGSPKTRDPKLLIAGSIREIAATLVGNRLRAVAV